MIRLLLVLAILLAAGEAAASECLPRPGFKASSGYWKYRIVAGRRCWYVAGRGVRPSRASFREAPAPRRNPPLPPPFVLSVPLEALRRPPIWLPEPVQSAPDPEPYDPCSDPLSCSVWPPLQARDGRLSGWMVLIPVGALGVAGVLAFLLAPRRRPLWRLMA